MSKKIVRKDSNKTKTGNQNLKVLNVTQLEDLKKISRPKMIPVINNRMNTMLRKAGRGR